MERGPELGYHIQIHRIVAARPDWGISEESESAELETRTGVELRVAGEGGRCSEQEWRNLSMGLQTDPLEAADTSMLS